MKYKPGDRFLVKDRWCTLVERIDDSYSYFIYDNSDKLVRHPNSNVAKGLVSDPYEVSVHGKGYFGVGSYSTKDQAYGVWVNMLKRCYNPTDKLKTYSGCSVSDDWFCFQTFASDYSGM